MTNPLLCHFVTSCRLNYASEHIILISTLVTVFTVRVGEHNHNVIIVTDRQTDRHTERERERERERET